MAEGRQDPRRDVAVIGASAGGVEALRAVVAGLPADHAGAVFVVLHVAPDASSVLGDILDRAGPLEAATATDGERVAGGRVYVAPPDHHLTVVDGRVRLDRGPRENGHRPAVDRLFRSAANRFGARVVGVVLSGAGDDGTAGLRTIKGAGGTAIVQDPADALYRNMPSSALANAAPDAVCRADEIGPRLAALAPAGERSEMTGDQSTQFEANTEHPAPEEVNGASGLRCPDCGGSLWELERDGLLRYECRIGHAYSAEGMIRAQGVALESILWSALSALEERADMLRRVSRRATDSGAERSAEAFRRKADDVDQQAGTLRDLLNAGPGEVPPQTDEVMDDR